MGPSELAPWKVTYNHILGSAYSLSSWTYYENLYLLTETPPSQFEIHGLPFQNK